MSLQSRPLSVRRADWPHGTMLGFDFPRGTGAPFLVLHLGFTLQFLYVHLYISSSLAVEKGVQLPLEPPHLQTPDSAEPECMYHFLPHTYTSSWDCTLLPWTLLLNSLRPPFYLQINLINICLKLDLCSVFSGSLQDNLSLYWESILTVLLVSNLLPDKVSQCLLSKVHIWVYHSHL